MKNVYIAGTLTITVKSGPPDCIDIDGSPMKNQKFHLKRTDKNDKNPVIRVHNRTSFEVVLSIEDKTNDGVFFLVNRAVVAPGMNYIPMATRIGGGATTGPTTFWGTVTGKEIEIRVVRSFKPSDGTPGPAPCFKPPIYPPDVVVEC